MQRTKGLIVVMGLLWVSTVARAQSWQLKLSGGYTYMTLPKASPYFTGQYFIRPYDYDGDSISKRSLSPAVSLSIGYTLKQKPLTVGIRLAAAELKRLNYGVYANPSAQTNLYVGRPAISIQLFVSYQYRGIYGGLMLGILGYFGKGPQAYNSHRHTGTGFIGFAGGAQLGYEYAILRRVQLFSELSCNYISTQQNYGAYLENVRFFQPMALIGLGYRFGK